MKIPDSKIVNDEGETDDLAAEYSKFVSPGDVVVLNGDLGSGKTFFIKKVLSNFEINNVSSPSFTIVNEYEGNIKAYHFDFFRLKKFDELLDIGWQDYLNDNNAVIFIEWGDLISKALPEKRVEISIAIIDDTMRRFEFKYYE